MEEKYKVALWKDVVTARLDMGLWHYQGSCWRTCYTKSRRQYVVDGARPLVDARGDSRGGQSPFHHDGNPLTDEIKTSSRVGAIRAMELTLMFSSIRIC
jgi:hypothetical protein